MSTVAITTVPSGAKRRWFDSRPVQGLAGVIVLLVLLETLWNQLMTERGLLPSSVDLASVVFQP